VVLAGNQIFNPENLGFRLKSRLNDAVEIAFMPDFRG